MTQGAGKQDAPGKNADVIAKCFNLFAVAARPEP